MPNIEALWNAIAGGDLERTLELAQERDVCPACGLPVGCDICIMFCHGE